MKIYCINWSSYGFEDVEAENEEEAEKKFWKMYANGLVDSEDELQIEEVRELDR